LAVRVGSRSFGVGHLCPQEGSQDPIAQQPLGPSLLGLLITQFGNFVEKSLLNLRLLLDTVEVFSRVSWLSCYYGSILALPFMVSTCLKGGKKCRPARAAKMNPEQRTESARKAVQARWAKVKVKKAD
jgi:hypothetical protein